MVTTRGGQQGNAGCPVFLRLVIIFSLLWAVLRSFLYGYLLDFLAWIKISVELNLVPALERMVDVEEVVTVYREPANRGDCGSILN